MLASSERRAVRLHERVRASRSNARSQTSSWIASRSARQWSTGPSRPNCSALFTARSNATHAMTFECVKCCGGPRTSQMPWSGCCQIFSSCSSERLLERPGLGALGDAADARLVERVHHLAVDVELELLVGGVADAHGFGVLVARQPGNLPLAEQPLAARART